MNKIAYLEGYLFKEAGMFSNFGRGFKDLAMAKEFGEGAKEASAMKQQTALRKLLAEAADAGGYLGSNVTKNGLDNYEVLHHFANPANDRKVINIAGADLTDEMRNAMRNLKGNATTSDLIAAPEGGILSEKEIARRLEKAQAARVAGAMKTGGLYGGGLALAGGGAALAAN